MSGVVVAGLAVTQGERDGGLHDQRLRHGTGTRLYLARKSLKNLGCVGI